MFLFFALRHSNRSTYFHQSGASSQARPLIGGLRKFPRKTLCDWKAVFTNVQGTVLRERDPQVEKPWKTQKLDVTNKIKYKQHLTSFKLTSSFLAIRLHMTSVVLVA